VPSAACAANSSITNWWCYTCLPQDVVREPYRLRILNGCNAKALIIYFRWAVLGVKLPSISALLLGVLAQRCVSCWVHPQLYTSAVIRYL
jgi:hypothetical protein